MGSVHSGLCWECNGVDLRRAIIRYDDYVREGDWRRAISARVRLQTQKSSARQSCALCVQLQALFQDRDDATQNLVLEHEEGDGTQGGYFYSIKLFSSRGNFRTLVVVPAFRASLRNGGEANLVKAKGWLDQCRLSCSKGHRRPRRSGKLPLRVMDCKTKTIRSMSAGGAYVCLSYVWGSKAAIETHGSHLPHDLPKTIEDAMYVAIQLGIPYLWCDRYCIDQNDPAAKHFAINNMDTIYHSASLTIIAASGAGPDYGLPGVRGTPRGSYHDEGGNRVVCPDFTGLIDNFVMVESPRSEILNSKWDTRGWTYQEMFLSRRRLVFTESQMYFQCENVNRQEFIFDPPDESEHECAEDSDTRSLNKISWAFPDASDCSCDQLYYCLQAYYARELSYGTDIPKVFIGVFKALESCEATHFYGIPLMTPSCAADQTTNIFLESLAWYLRMNESWERPPIVDYTYPSWTWASVKLNRPQAEPGALRFSKRGYQGLIPPGKDILVSLTRKTRGYLDLQVYGKGLFDYETFLPQIDIKSWSIKCAIRKSKVPKVLCPLPCWLCPRRYLSRLSSDPPHC